MGRAMRELARLDDECLARWRAEGGSAMTTLDLRSAAHAAQRRGDTAAERELDGWIALRESRGDTA